MPVYDRKCDKCGIVKEDCLETFASADFPCACNGIFKRVWLPGSSAAVIGDEIDVTVAQVVASNPDGSPRRFRSREELKRVTEANGYTNLVEHRGGKGSDKSIHTTRWT